MAPSTLCSRLTAGDCSSTMPCPGFHTAFTRFPLRRLKISLLLLACPTISYNKLRKVSKGNKLPGGIFTQ